MDANKTDAMKTKSVEKGKKSIMAALEGCRRSGVGDCVESCGRTETVDGPQLPRPGA